MQQKHSNWEQNPATSIQPRSFVCETLIGLSVLRCVIFLFSFCRIEYPVNILIHEPNHRGHRFTTVRVLLDALLSIKMQGEIITSITISTTEEALDSKEFEHQLAAVREEFDVIRLEKAKISHPLTLAYQQMGNLKQLINSQRFDYIYIPYADAVLQLLTLNRLWPLQRWWPAKVPVEAQIMHSSFAYPITKFSRKLLSIIAVRWSGCARVHLNDPLGIEFIKRKHPSFLEYVSLVPDPISETKLHDKRDARQALSLPIGCRIIGCVGLLDERKGTDILIKSFVSSNIEITDKLLLAGTLSPGVRDLVHKIDHPNIIAYDRYVTEEELSLALSASDLIATPYPDVVGSASIVIRAAMAGRMVLTNDTGWAGYVVPRFQLGLTAPVNDLKQFTLALEQALSIAPDFKQNQLAKEFCQFNTISNIHAHWTSLIRHKLKLGESNHYKKWPF